MTVRAKPLYAFGPFRLDPAQHLLFRDHAVVALTPKALDTLLLLVNRRGQLVTKDELLQQVWPDTFVEEATLAKNISTLRKALGEQPGGGEYIETHSKRGYRFVAEVREISDQPAPSPEALPVDSSRPVKAAPHSRRRRVVAILVGALLVASATLLWYPYRPVVPAANGRIMLAVMPFENLSGDPQQEYFSNGLTEEMITQLGRLEPGRLGVIARTSAMHYKGLQKDTRQIGRELGVDYLLEGSVRREGSRVRIAAQLVRVADRSQQWADTYDRDLRDILAVQGEVAGAIAQQIRLQLSPEQHARLLQARTVNPEAYENYLKGRFFWNKRSAEGHAKAIEYFQKAVVQDPGYVQAYAGLADAYALLASTPNSVMPRDVAMDHARAAAQKALSLDDSLADAHASLGFVKMHYDWDFDGAEKEYQRAIALNPGYATAHQWYAFDLVALARLDDALAEMRRAQQADPLSVIISRDVGEMLLYAGHTDEAIAQCRKTLEMDPGFYLAHWELAFAYFQQGNQKAFLEELRLAGAGYESAKAIRYAIQGKRQEAHRILADSAKAYGSAHQSASVYGFLGENDRAFALLDKAIEEHNGALIIIRFAPEWNPLRSDPRFEQVERRVGVLR